MERKLKKIYNQTQAPQAFRFQLLEILVQGNSVSVERDGIFRRLEFWALVSAVVTVSIIVYGLWLPSNINL